MNLTPRQKEIFEFIQSYLGRCGVAPTVSEIRMHFKLNSLATVHKHLKALERRGWIHRSKNQARAIELSPRSALGVLEVPLFGLIAAGQPIEALEAPETLGIPEDLLGRQETFALQVTGNSMIEDGIHDGDFIIVESKTQARDGEIVVALINNEEATVKRFYREGSQVRLQPSNEKMDPIYVKTAQVQVRGVVIGLIRKYRKF